MMGLFYLVIPYKISRGDKISLLMNFWEESSRKLHLILSK